MGNGRESLIGRGMNAQDQDEVVAKIRKQLEKSDFSLTDDQKRLLQDLYDWQERSRETNWILGEPLGVRT